LLAELDRRQRTNRLKDYRPYQKQKDFHAQGASYRERLFMAGNQLGKTVAGAFETAMHLTGRYPDWWQGRRFDAPVTWLAGSESSELTRDGVQRLLLGPPSDAEQWGTGSIPGDAIVDVDRRQGVANAVDTIVVKHVSGGNSTLGLKSYDQGRAKWQANTVNGVWFDEEPPEDVYTEGLTRTNATGGMVLLTFTPLKGMSDVVRRFLMETHNDRGTTTMTIDDAEHYTPEERARIIASYPQHEREARTKGIPILGSGRIFPVAEEDIACEPFALPKFWPRIGAMDFGWDHPFAAVELVLDLEGDVIYVTRTYRARQETPILHAKALKPWGDWLPWAWPHDGLQHSKDSGEPLAKQYKANGLKMLGSHATFPDGSTGVEAGLFEMLERMQTGRFKVFKHLGDWFEEFRLYHRKDGKVVKEHDDLMASTRYGVMSMRHSIIQPSALISRKTQMADPLQAYR
jgi:phage terminase large subunit-like protein